MKVVNAINAIITTAVHSLGYSRTELHLNKSNEWCAEFISFCLKAGNQDKVTSFSCNQMYSLMKASPYWYEPDDSIKAGDILFFNWHHTYDNGLPLDHVAVVVSYENGIVTYIDGNSDSSGLVREHTISVNRLNFNCEYPDIYMRMCEPEQEVQEEKKDETLTEINKALEALNVLKKYFENL